MRSEPLLLLLAALSTALPAEAGPRPMPWMDRALPPEQRARLLLNAMTLDEKIALVHARFGTPMSGRPKPDGALNSAGFAPGVPRLSIPPLIETDAGLGIANPTVAPFYATAMPSGLALGATFDPALARAGGVMIGAEARAHGFSVLLAGGANLTRDPRNGRNFEYIGEDPLLTGTMVGATVAGAQSQDIATTIKHFALNDQETGRVILSADISEKAARESDLLAFEIALERGAPASVMTGYNRVNNTFASENDVLLDILKHDWSYRGWVMSDWGGTHSTEKAALAGLDQESGEESDPKPFFGAPLRAAVDAGRVPIARLDDMVSRILRSELRIGLVDDPPKPDQPIDQAKDAGIAEEVARRSIVLLKNDAGRLPLNQSAKRILVVGEHADFGVLSGGGSSQVIPPGALRFLSEPPEASYKQPKVYDPSSPLGAIRAEAVGATVEFNDGHDPALAAEAARHADAVIVFAEQWMSEGRDAPSLVLPDNQNALITTIASANPKTIVVLQTGGPVLMPWLDAVPAVVEAWYSGQRGGQAIASVLFGRVDPAGRLPITFPRDETQLPRPRVPHPVPTTSNPGEPLKGPPFGVDYDIEGADVGYKWFLKTNRQPLFPFGFGLSYTRFSHGAPEVSKTRETIEVGFDVTNTGARDGVDTPQVYLDSPDGLFARRLVGWKTVALRPGETRRVVVTVDPRLFATFDTKRRDWRIADGRYTASVRASAVDAGREQSFLMAARDIRP